MRFLKTQSSRSGGGHRGSMWKMYTGIWTLIRCTRPGHELWQQSENSLSTRWISFLVTKGLHISPRYFRRPPDATLRLETTFSTCYLHHLALSKNANRPHLAMKLLRIPSAFEHLKVFWIPEIQCHWIIDIGLCPFCMWIFKVFSCNCA